MFVLALLIHAYDDTVLAEQMECLRVLLED
jgi:hypothetical protein